MTITWKLRTGSHLGQILWGDLTHHKTEIEPDSTNIRAVLLRTYSRLGLVHSKAHYLQ